MNVGIIGCGTLGSAIAMALREHDGIEQLCATTRRGERLDERLAHVVLMSDNATLAGGSDVVLICVKPLQVEAVVREIAPVVRTGHILITCAAGVTTGQVRNWLGSDRPLIRAMPNAPARIREGMTVLASSNASERDMATAVSLFEAMGRVSVIEESLMDAATGISGCGPAYVYMIVEALSEAGVKLGLPRATAQLLATQTLLGAAKMVLVSGLHPAALKDEVTTPAGCTIDALMQLEDGKLRSTLIKAAVAAAERSASLSR